jgi:HEAT repeat protein
VREMSAWALGTIERDVDVAVLATVLARDTDDRVRETLVWALGNIGDRASVDALGRVAESDKSSRVRGTAAWALGTMRGRDRRAPAGLVRLLRDEEEQTRLKAAWALGNIGDSTALGPIRDALKAEQEQQVRRALIRALLHSGGRSEGAMEELLKSDDPTVREAAVRGLVGRNAFDPWPWPWPRPRPFP